VDPIPGLEVKVGVFDFGAQAARIKNNNVMMIKRFLESLSIIILLHDWFVLVREFWKPNIVLRPVNACAV
jgi:hypothetical protein